MITKITKKKMIEIDEDKYYLDAAVAKEIAVGLLTGDLALKEWERQREYFDTYYMSSTEPVIRQETLMAVIHIEGYKVTIEREG